MKIPRWPNGARIAVNCVINYEDGSEPSVQDGEDYTETGLTEAHGLGSPVQGRDLAAEGMFEYGSRVGFWRLHRLFEERRAPPRFSTLREGLPWGRVPAPFLRPWNKRSRRAIPGCCSMSAKLPI